MIKPREFHGGTMLGKEFQKCGYEQFKSHIVA